MIALRGMRPVRLWLYLMVEPTGLVDKWNMGEGKLKKIQWSKQLEERRAHGNEGGMCSRWWLPETRPIQIPW